MNKLTFLLFLSPTLLLAQQSDETIDTNLNTIAFGSCSRQMDADKQLWADINAAQPDLWIWLGDNIYADTEDMEVMRQKYDQQKSHPGYQALLNSTEVIGIWDDHDYGVNDGGKEYPMKDESKAELFRFLEVSPDHPAHERIGAYQSYTFKGDLTVKFILLDTRYFRDPLKKDDKNWNVPDQTGKVLGEVQWKWFGQQLQDKEADVLIIGSSIQAIPEEHRYEKWGNFPTERDRLFQLIEANVRVPTVLISGDRHISEVSRIELDGYSHPLYELTSSSLTNPWGEPRDEPNIYREKAIVFDPNFALLSFDQTKKQLKMKVTYLGKGGKKLQSHTLAYDR